MTFTMDTLDDTLDDTRDDTRDDARDDALDDALDDTRGCRRHRVAQVQLQKILQLDHMVRSLPSVAVAMLPTTTHYGTAGATAPEPSAGELLERAVAAEARAEAAEARAFTAEQRAQELLMTLEQLHAGARARVHLPLSAKHLVLRASSGARTADEKAMTAQRAGSHALDDVGCRVGCRSLFGACFGTSARRRGQGVGVDATSGQLGGERTSERESAPIEATAGGDEPMPHGAGTAMGRCDC